MVSAYGERRSMETSLSYTKLRHCDLCNWHFLQDPLWKLQNSFLWLLSFILFYRVAPFCGPSLSLLRWNPDHCFSCHEDDAFDRLDKKWWEPICRKPIWLRQAISLDSLNAPNKIWVLLGPFVLHMRRILDGGSHCHILYTHTYIYMFVLSYIKLFVPHLGPNIRPSFLCWILRWSTQID